MPDLEIILGLLLAVVLLSIAARRLKVAYPILLVVGGLVMGFIPNLPSVELRPDLVFLLFLPPLLFYASLTSSLRAFQRNIRPIVLLAVGLVIATTCAVAAIAHAAIPGFTWPVAFVLGTIVAPTDEVAATAIAQRLGLPRRLLALLEAESLLNDATALVLYTVAVSAVVGGSFSLVTAGVQFVGASVGGVAIGLAAGWGIAQVRRRLYDPPVENTISLLTGFAAYIPAQALHLSGVVAVVVQGLYLGRRGPSFVSARTRVQNGEMWAIVTYVLNGLLFILTGLQLHRILGRLSSISPTMLMRDAVIAGAGVILIRILWVFPATYLPRLLVPRIRARDPYPPWQQPWIVAWTGMRGAVSLAAALALPSAIDAGGPFPQRDLIIFLTFSVILATLVVQGLSLPIMIERMDLHGSDKADREDVEARLASAQAGLERLAEIESRRDGVPQDMIDTLREYLEEKQSQYESRADDPGNEAHVQRRTTYREVRREVLDAERKAVVDLRDRGVIDDEVMRRIQHELDLEDVRLQS